MVRRVLESRALRWGFIIVAAGFAVAAFVRYRDQVAQAVDDLTLADLAVALVLALLGTGASYLGWRALMADLGSPLPVRAAVRIMGLAQLGKYVPGSIWPIVAQVELGRAYGVPRRRAAAGSLLLIIVSLVTGVLVAAITLPAGASSVVPQAWWLLVVAPIGLAALHPAVLNRALDLLLRVARRPPLEHPLTLGGIVRTASWTAIGWLLLGAHVWWIVRALGAEGDLQMFLAATGAYTVAWIAGFLVIFAPAGAGVREVVLAAALASWLETGQAVLLVLVSRLVVTLADLLWAGVGVALGGRLSETERAAAVAERAAETEP